MSKVKTLGVTFKVNQYRTEVDGKVAYHSDYHRAVRWAKTFLGPERSKDGFKVGAAYSHEQYGNVVELHPR